MPGSPLKSIRQIAIAVHDVPRAVAFYRDVLEVPFLFEAGPTLAFFDCGGVRLMLAPPEPELKPPGSVLYFLVDDIDATHQRMKGRGVTFIGEPHVIARMPDHDLWLCEFKDSEGNFLALMEERRPPRAPDTPTA